MSLVTDPLEAVKRAHPFITYADLYQLAGNVAHEYMGSPSLFWRPGRRDFTAPAETGRLCVGDASRIPQKRFNNDNFPHPDTLQHFFDVFERLDISLDRDALALHKAAALMGGHQMGGMHTEVSNNEGVWTANNLVFGNEYFFNLENGNWGRGTAQQGQTDLQYRGGPGGRFTMLPIDMVMRADNRLRNIVRQFAQNRQQFNTHYLAAWRHVQELGM